MHSPMRPHFNWHSSNDESQQPPQATGQCMAVSTPKWQPRTKRGTRQIMKRSNIPRDLWKYYIKAPKNWDHNDCDETGLHNGIKSISMMNSFQNVIPWWMQNPSELLQTMSLDRLIRLKLKFTSVVRVKEELERFFSEVKHNNHLDPGYIKQHAFALNLNLQAARVRLLTEACSTPHEPLDEIFRLYIENFVTTIEDDGEKLCNYIIDSADETTPPTSPQQNSLTPDKVRNDAAVDVGQGDTHVKRMAENLEASPPMASRNSPNMLMLPQDNVEAIIEPATTLNLQHKDSVYEKEEDKENNENHDTDTEEENIETTCAVCGGHFRTKSSTVKENGDEHETKNDEVPADGKYNVDETLIKNRKEATEKKGAFNNILENAYGTNSVQTDVTGSCCEKCGITFTSKEDFRRHLIKSHETNAYDIIYICLYTLIFCCISIYM